MTLSVVIAESTRHGETNKVLTGTLGTTLEQK